MVRESLERRMKVEKPGLPRILTPSKSNTPNDAVTVLMPTTELLKSEV